MARSARSLLLALAAGLAVADASVVTLALPELLNDLATTVEGVAAVIGVYTVVLALSLLPAEAIVARRGPRVTGTAGFALFGVASLVCARAGTLPVLLVARGVQAAGGAAGLIAAFALLHADARPAGRLWLAAAVLGAAVGPALGGALTEAFSWHAIFVAQAPVAALAALACAASRDEPATRAAPARTWTSPGRGVVVRAGLGLALVSAALTAVLFLLVLLIVAGWNVAPLRAAEAVSVLPIAALAGARLRGGTARARAALGAGLIGAGTLALAFIPQAHLAWTALPQALAGIGMGLALPALAGELLPERTPREAAILLTVRHAGIALALALLAPIVAGRIDSATFTARERGVALVLDAKLPPKQKLALAPALLNGVEVDRPRAGLREAISDQRPTIAPGDLPAYDHLAKRADDTLVGAVSGAFDPAFAITGVLALIGALLLVPWRRRRLGSGPAGRTWPRPALPLAVLATLAVGGQAIAHHRLAPAPVALRDPCKKRPLPHTGGVSGFLQDNALRLLDVTACRLHSTREELVLALSDKGEAKGFEKRHGVDPRSPTSLIGGLLGIG